MTLLSEPLNVQITIEMPSSPYFASFSCGRSLLLTVKYTLIPFNLHTQFILKCPCRYAWSSKLEAVNYTVKKEERKKLNNTPWLRVGSLVL